MRIHVVKPAIVPAVLACLLAFSCGAIEAQGEEGAGNNLSYPAVLIDGVTTDPVFTVLNDGLGETYSYGCEGVEVYNVFSYPNTSCVDDLATPTIYYTAEECAAAGGKCEGKAVDRIYWQKEADNMWSSQVTGVSSITGSAPVNVRFVDWGDSIEVVNWNDYSVLRVETQPFVDLSQDPLSELPPEIPQTQTGFQMYHVSGQGITEQWGARVEENAGVRGLPYAYQSPYAIINAGSAQLYLTKLFPADANDLTHKCPAMGGDQPPVYPADYPFARDWTAGTGWSDSCDLPAVPFTLEQSVSGKFVHGYNWRMRNLPNPLSTGDCGDNTWQKTGWWRLTFVPNGGASKMLFTDNTVTGPPEIPPAIPTLISPAEEEVETTLYTPVVDVANNLTYIDICIVGRNSTYVVLPSVNGGGTISPSEAQVVEQNDTVSFVLSPDPDYTIEIMGSCPVGSMIDNLDDTWTYTTGSIKSDCTVIANFIGVNQLRLLVNTLGTGTGTVTSSPAGIDCGDDCLEYYDYNTEVTLTATADPDSFFAGWSGDADCSDGIVTMDAEKDCSPTFNKRYVITASASPFAGGEVSCIPNPVLPDSNSTCTVSTNPHYTLDTVTGSCGGTLVESVYTTDVITADCSVVANFSIDRFGLTVTTAGTGTGTVTSSPPGIDCGEDCSEDYDYNTVVNLTATASADSVFTSWSGDADCSDGVVAMDAAKSCIATFTEGYTITASASPVAGGSVSCDPNPVPVLPGSASTCTIVTNPHYTLDTVTGTCGGTLVGSDYTTDVITADCTVVANFVIDRFGLLMTTAGTGAGTVTSSPAGIDCGGDCSEDYDYGTVVTLTATADVVSVFTGWSGDADCSDGIVTMDAAKSCIATFVEGYTIAATASPPEGGEVSCEPKNPVIPDSVSTCTISTNPQYTFDTVTGTCGGTLVGDIYTTDAISADCTVIATFDRKFPWSIFLQAILKAEQ